MSNDDNNKCDNYSSSEQPLSDDDLIPDSLRLKAGKCLSSGDFSEAVHILEEGRKMFPNDIKIRNNLGQAYALTGAHECAYRELSEVIKMDPSIAVAWITLIRLIVSAANYDHARDIVERASIEGVNADDLLPFRMLLLNHDNMYSLAFQLGYSASPAISQSELFVSQYAEALSHCNKTDLGISVCEDYLSINPVSVDVRLQYALLLQQVGRTDDAFHQLELVQPQTKLDSLNISQARVTIAEDCGLDTQAIRDAEFCFNNQHDRPRNAHILFSLYVKTGDWDNAWNYNRYRGSVQGSTGILPYDLPTWTIHDTSAHVYVYSEQGLGDHVFAYKTLFHYCAITSTHNIFFFEVPNKLIKILPSTANIIVIPAKGGESHSKSEVYTHHIRMYDLLELVFRAVRPDVLFYNKDIHHSLSKAISKQIIPDSQSDSKHSLSGVFGLSWRSNNPNVGNQQSMDLAQALDMLLLSNINTALSLQYLPTSKEQETAAHHACHLILPDIDIYNDIHGNLSLMARCSHIITVSTLTVHLAGLLSIPTSLLVCPGRAKLWYWFLKANKTSLVYPNVRIYEKETRTDSYSHALGAALADIGV